MADVACIQAYIESTVIQVYDKWGNLLPEERINQVYLCINRVLVNCGIPQLHGYGKARSTSLGQFGAASWKIYLDESFFRSVPDEAPSVKDFIEMAAVVDHEGRHAEQYWYIACFLAAKYRSNSYINLLDDAKSLNSPSDYEPIDDSFDLSYNAGYLAAYVGINYQVADQAIRKPLSNNHPNATTDKNLER